MEQPTQQLPQANKVRIMKHTIYKEKIPIYHGEIWIIFSDDFIESGKELGIEFRKSANECLGLALRKEIKGPGVYCIFIKTHKRLSVDVLAHEALHIVNYIFEDRGISINTKNDEPQAYMLGWVLSNVYKAALKQGEKKMISKRN